MRLLFIRHGDPDYVHDTLTEKGHREAALLAEYAPALNTGTCFVSPLGRAQATAAYSLKALGKTAETLGWLQEFPARIDLNEAADLRRAYPNAVPENGKYAPRIVWDVAPSYLNEHSWCLEAHKWRESNICAHSDTLEVYDRVTSAFDRFLAERGYVRDGRFYRVERENRETVTFFCHFGITCVFLAHLWGVSPFLLWHNLALAPTSVTEVVTEEREQGIACFRGLKLGDVSHLVLGGEPVSTSARFCEVYSDDDRH
ncbi:MAG TPA: histidine phosphatase family protein [Candidatus Mediterraneibacter merdipullorum]|nr:histidine phosphatase family protein [Candidatus Mediterraneibacter merdipullorum]